MLSEQPESSSSIIGSNYADHGCSYTELLRLRSLQNPCLRGLVMHMKHAAKLESTIRLLEYDVHGTVLSRPAQFDRKELPRLFERPGKAVGRVLLIESIRPEIISCLGEQLDVDPIFFADYITTDFQGLDKAPPPPSLAFCPSQIVERGHVTIHYQQVMRLKDTDRATNAKYGLYTEHNVPRNIRRLPPLSGTQLALSRSCCSILVKRLHDTWYTIILTDPPVTEVFQEPKRVGKKIYLAEALHGGFENFQQSTTDSEDWDKRSMLSSLQHYFQNHPPGFRTSNPSTLCFAYYPMRIALAEWVLYSHLVSRFHKYYEYSLQDVHKRPLESDIVDLQRWRRRITQSRQKLSILSQFITYWKKDEVDKQPWDMLLLDIESIISKLEHYGHSMEQVVPVATGMVQLIDARESARQAANVTTLTYIATVFVPLSWMAGLFSMSGGFLPGGDKFWVYIATAFPLSLLVLLVSVVPLRHMAMSVGRFLRSTFQWSRRRVTKDKIEDGFQHI